MARLPTRPLILKNGEEKVAEARLLTPMVRVWRFLRWVIVLVLLVAAFGAGVMSGTSGQFADGVAEVRRWTQTAPGDEGRLATALTILERLDAAEGIEALKTRHGVATTLGDLTTICRAEIARIEESVAQIELSMIRAVGFQLQDVGRAISGVEAATTDGMAELQETAEVTATMAANAETDCGQTHLLLDSILSVPSSDTTTDRDVADIEE